MNKRQMTTCVLALLAITSLPTQAKNIEIKVAGSITPSGCTPTLSGGGIVNYGTIASDTLTLDDYTVLDQKSVDLTITCDAPTLLAIEAKNGRPNTLAGVVSEDETSGAGRSPISKAGFRPEAVVGLGLSGEARIGGYAIEVGSASADDSLIFRDGSSGKWSSKGLGSLYSIGAKRQISWMKRSALDLEPTPYQTLTINIAVQAYINKASELDLTKPVVLDGLSTIELIYL